MKSIKNIKIPIIVMTAVASLIGMAELYWLRSQKSLDFGIWEFGVYMLPWLCMSAGFLALLHLNLFSPERAKMRTQIISWIGFVMVTSVLLALWITIVSRFILLPS
ncbi:MAG: hypothetical protein JW896_03110 [Deltaproteobacteria bacterium]|nr:hypothetical protein [Deltaproteobacteria bacterium]